MIHNLMSAGKRYVNDMELCDIAALKFCLMALGILIGIAIPKGARKPSALWAAVIFVGSFVALMGKFFAYLTTPRVK